MLRVAEDLLSGAQLDEFPGAHDGDPCGDLRHHRKAVRDQQVGQAKLLLQFLQQYQHLCTNGNIQRGNRLIGNDQLRPQNQRARDADALALAAGKFVRIARRRLFVLGRRARSMSKAAGAARMLRELGS